MWTDETLKLSSLFRMGFERSKNKMNQNKESLDSIRRGSNFFVGMLKNQSFNVVVGKKNSLLLSYFQFWFFVVQKKKNDFKSLSFFKKK
jgi:hypothetical protein